MDLKKECIQRNIKLETENETYSNLNESFEPPNNCLQIKFEDNVSQDQIENELEAITNSPHTDESKQYKECKSVPVTKPIDVDLNTNKPVCRLCARPIKGNEIFLYEDKNLEEKIKYILPINICIGDGFSQYICCNCESHLNTFYDFVCQVVNADNLIRGKLNPPDVKNSEVDVTNATIKEIFGADLNELEQIKPTTNSLTDNLKDVKNCSSTDLLNNKGCLKRKGEDVVKEQKMKKIREEPEKLKDMDISDNPVTKSRYFCPESECMEYFHTQKALCEHIKEHHNFPVICLECGKIFTNQQALDKHTSNMHCFKTCHICGMSFKTVLSYSTHIALHATVNEYQCVYCYKNFKNRHKLLRHTRESHSGNFKVLVDGKERD